MVRTRAQLEHKTLDVSLSHRDDGEFLEVQVKLVNKAGHKFPTGYPERRAWLHVRVMDSSKHVLLESGNYDDRGRIVGRNNESFEPHHDVIETEDQVQIYEIVPADQEGEPTHRLLDAAQAVKDNRLLPSGFDPKSHELGKDVEVVGEAVNDRSFDASGGSDIVTYRVRAPNTPKIVVEVSVLYQSIRPGAMDDLRSFETPDVRAFFDTIDGLEELPPEVIAAETLTIQN
jgi:hypothetical protein